MDDASTLLIKEVLLGFNTKEEGFARLALTIVVGRTGRRFGSTQPTRDHNF